MAFHWGKRILRFIILLLGVSILCFILTALSSIDPVTYIIRRGIFPPRRRSSSRCVRNLDLTAPFPSAISLGLPGHYTEILGNPYLPEILFQKIWPHTFQPHCGCCC